MNLIKQSIQPPSGGVNLELTEGAKDQQCKVRWISRLKYSLIELSLSFSCFVLGLDNYLDAR